MLNDMRNSTPSSVRPLPRTTLAHMTKPPRKPLASWQKEDAARLKALFDSAALDTQEDFGLRNGIGSQALVWQYLNGYIPLNLRAALKFARGLGCSVAEFSPTLAAEIYDENTHPQFDLRQVLDSIPEADAAQVVDFLVYKVERSAPLKIRELLSRQLRELTTHPSAEPDNAPASAKDTARSE